MIRNAEIEALQRELQRLRGRAEARLFRRYGRLRPLERTSAWRRARKLAGALLRRLGIRKSTPPEPWIPMLKHAPAGDDARPLVIWALGLEREALRAACRNFQELQVRVPQLVPVLVTDVADFAFFSRLGWLVEYVPALGAPASRYAERKRRYLAWRYRDARVVPASVGLGELILPEELLLE
jgi:hypothetical protein